MQRITASESRRTGSSTVFQFVSPAARHKAELCKEGKQAEFLIEQRFPWELVSRIGVQSRQVCHQTEAALEAATHRPFVEIRGAWYY